MGKPQIKLYVDLVSPFAYLAYWYLRNSPTFKACDIEYVPMFLGGLMKTCGNTAPLFIKNKDKWINRERLSWSSLFKIPMRTETPPGFPVPTINAQRLLVALEQKSPAHIPKALDRLYNAIWSPDTLPNPPKPKGTEYNINKSEDLLMLLSPDDVLGNELAETVVKAIGSPEVKQALNKSTEVAFSEGAFGLPWFQCTNESGEVQGFWGFDHLGQVVRFLGLDGPDGQSSKMRPML